LTDTTEGRRGRKSAFAARRSSRSAHRTRNRAVFVERLGRRLDDLKQRAPPDGSPSSI